MLHQVLLHDVDEVEVECGVDEQVDDLLSSVPPLIDVNILLANLQACWDPDAVDGYVDGRNGTSDSPLDA